MNALHGCAHAQKQNQKSKEPCASVDETISVNFVNV
jgi:hypothetical protein